MNAAGAQPPAWSWALREDHVKHKWPDHMGPPLCESMLWCTSLTLSCLYFGSACTLCQPTLVEHRATVCPSIHCCMRHRVTPIQLGCAGYHGFLSAHLCHRVAIPIATLSHCFNFTSDVPRNWPLLMAK